MGPRLSATLKTSDIVIPRRKYNERRTWKGQQISSLNTRDIAGQYNRLHHVMGPSVKTYGNGFKPYNSLEVRDIDGAYCKRLRDPRNTHPLEPEYKLPSHQTAPPPQPKFLRETNRLGDIRGAQVVSRTAHIRTRQSLKVHDIRGTRSKPQTFTRTFGHAKEPLDHRDITATDFKTKRLGHSPLDPEYSYGRSTDLSLSTVLNMPASDSLKARLEQAGGIKPNQRIRRISGIAKSKPKPNKPYRSLQNRSNTLKTKDVPGATIGWTPEWKSDRTQFGDPTRTDDIVGAQAGTRRRLRTKRETNPLNPGYKMIGHSYKNRKGGRGSQLSSTGREISQIVLG